MRILPLSDLHREIYPNRDLGINLAVSKPDVVVLAGDIDQGIKAVQWAADTFPGIPVLYVAGNHEYYGGHIDTMPEKIQEACDASPNVTFLNGEQYAVIDGVLFLGATLWTDFRLFGDEHRDEAMMRCEQGMNDYHKIRVANTGYRKLAPKDTARLHANDHGYIWEMLAAPFSGKRVVISHMSPSLKSVPDKYRTQVLSAAFASHLDSTVEKADLWIHGHTHTSMDYTIGKCRVVANPCGCVEKGGNNENVTFNPHLIIEI